MRKRFSTAAIVTCALDRLVCPIKDVYELLGFMVREDLFTHQLPRASRASEPFLKKQCPWLNEINESECNEETVQRWLEDIERKFGKSHMIRRMPKRAWKHIGPLEEIIKIKSGIKL